MPALSAPPQVVFHKEVGFTDFVFFISHVQSNQYGAIIQASALDGKTDVGFELEVPNSWRDTTAGPKNELHLHQGAIGMLSDGVSSDALISTMQRAYGQPEKAASFAKTVHATAISLSGDPAKVLTEVCQIKLFFGEDTGKDAPYAEVFLDIDVKNKVVLLKEKDPEYRADLLKFLTGEAPDLMP